MMKQLISIFIFISIGFMFSCSTHKAMIDNSNKTNIRDVTVWEGSSYETAVIIEKTSETEGVEAEYQWIRDHFPGSQVLSQSLNFYKEKPYDILQITTNQGEAVSIYFDISKYFGKF
jgi:hypothetical protein